MQRELPAQTCESLQISSDCYNTWTEAYEAQVAIATYEGDSASAAYYSSVLDCWETNGFSMLCEDE